VRWERGSGLKIKDKLEGGSGRRKGGWEQREEVEGGSGGGRKVESGKEGGSKKGRLKRREGVSERKEWKGRVEGERKRRMNEWMVQWMDRVMEDEGSGSEEDRGMDKREGRSVGGRKNGMGMWVSRGDGGRARGLE